VCSGNKDSSKRDCKDCTCPSSHWFSPSGHNWVRTRIGYLCGRCGAMTTA